jgi:hypothetical protein
VSLLVTLIALGTAGAVPIGVRRQRRAGERIEGRARRQLRALAIVPIATVPDGVVARIEGVVEALETIPASVTGRLCVGYESLVEESGPMGNSWRRVARHVGITPFLVRDDSGVAFIDAEHGQIYLAKDHSMSGGTTRRKFLVRYQEGILEAGTRVTVVGAGIREPDPDPAATPADYRGAPAMRLHLTGTRKHPVTIANDVMVHRVEEQA